MDARFDPPASDPPHRSPSISNRSASPSRRYFVAAVVIVAVMIVLAFALTDGFHRGGGGPSPEVLVHAGTLYAIPGGQFNGITLVLGAPSVLNSSFVNTYGLQLYTMNFTQYNSYTKTSIIPGYEWTSGRIANETIYNLELTIPAGSWVFAFVNPSAVTQTDIGFYSDLTVTPA